jgi:hypothetical protein
MTGTPAPAILWPAVAMASLTFLVWVRLYHLRLGEMARKRIDAQALASAADSARLLLDTRASDNFRNLFELPVLFYAALLLALWAGADDPALRVLAWSFAAARVVHSGIHCTYNRVMHRFAVYALGGLLLWTLWARLCWLLLSA